MSDVYEAFDMKLVRLLRTFGSGNAEQPGTLSPDPWHFSLFASSMIQEEEQGQEQGDASTMTASPMPLGCRGARGACQQSPILHSSESRLPARRAVRKGQAERLLFLYHAIGLKRKMPGVWGQSPQDSQA